MNSQSYHDLYKKNTIKLAGTMRIKSSMQAKKLNDAVILFYGEDAVDITKPETWKYYLNLSGEYHSLDPEIKIISLDTHEEIVFNKKNLKLHPYTYKHYKYGSRYFEELLYNYPNQELLILGILYPTDIKKAIEAQDGTVLNYEKELIEKQEENLIFEIQEWIQSKFFRWDVKAFNLSDDYYVAAHFAILCLNLVPKIMNLRLKYAKTRQAHSYHIYEYLNSHSHISDYYDYLSFKQKMFFYRNILYLERNGGTEETFNLLIQKLFSDQFISVANYSIHKKDIVDEKWYTQYDFLKHPLNTEYNVPPKDIYTQDEINEKINDLTPWTNDYLLEHADEESKVIQNGQYNIFLSKLIEVASLNFTDYYEYKRYEIMIDHWLYMASKDLYTNYIYFTDPHTKQTINLNAKNAALYLIYNLSRIIGSNSDTIPSFTVRRIFTGNSIQYNDLINLPGIKEVRSISFDEDVLKLFNKKPFMPLATNFEIFNTFAEDVYDFNVECLFSRAKQQDYNRHRAIKHISHQFFSDIELHFDKEGMKWDDWRNQLYFFDDNYSQNERISICYDLIKNATPVDIQNEYNARYVKKAMVNLAKRLGSYTTLWIDHDLDTELTSLSLPYSRINNNNRKEKYYEQMDILGNVIRDFKEFIHNKDNIDLKKVTIESSSILKQEDKVGKQLMIQKNINPLSINISIRFYPMYMVSSYDNKDSTVFENKTMAGYENYLSLTDIQKNSLIDAYSN